MKLSFRNGNGIARRLTTAVIIFSSIFTLVITAIQLYVDFSDDLEIIDQAFNSIQNSQVSLMTNSVWAHDIEQINTQLNGLLQLRDIEYAAISIKGEVQWSSGHLINNPNTHIFPLSQLYRGENIEIGSLMVSVNMENLYDRLWSRLLNILISNSIKTFFVAVFILLLFQYLVTRHLYKIAHYTENLEFPSSNKIPLTLNRKNRKRHENDALERVTNAINFMHEKIGDAHKSMHATTLALKKETVKANKATRDLLDQKYVLDNHAIVAVTDRKGNITYVNDKFCSISGYSEKELLGQNHRILNSQHHPESFFYDLWHTISKGGVWHGEICNKAKDGHQYWLETTIAPTFNTQGRINHYIAIRTDITSNKKNEQKLIQSQKMEALGQFTVGVVHDFNNILSIILSNIELVQILSKDDPQIAKQIDTALVGLNRGIALTKKLLGFSANKAVYAEVLSINALLKREELDIRNTLPPSLQMEYKLDTDLWAIKADPNDLENAILNLTLNARDAMPDGGKIKISTYNTTLDNSTANGEFMNSVGDYAVISVSDNGHGMSEGVKQRILEPFFTTKTSSKGTGLGLSMVHGFIERSEGLLTIQTTEGRGTDISLLLPKTDEELITTSHSDLKLKRVIGQETILLADDEAELCIATQELLERLGYTVLTAHSAEEALAILSQDQSVDLLLSDIIMTGGMNGYELALDVSKKWPKLKIVLASGFDENARKRVIGNDPEINPLIKNLLRKPYNYIELSTAIRKVLDSD